MAIKYYSNLFSGDPKISKFKPDRINWKDFPSDTDKSHFKKGTLTLRDYINSSVGSGSVPQYDFQAGEKVTDDKTFMFLRDQSLTMAEKLAINKKVQSNLSKELKEQLNNLNDDLILKEIDKNNNQSKETQD